MTTVGAISLILSTARIILLPRGIEDVLYHLYQFLAELNQEKQNANHQSY
jgi:hypothetical protein